MGGSSALDDPRIGNGELEAMNRAVVGPKKSLALLLFPVMVSVVPLTGLSIFVNVGSVNVGSISISEPQIAGFIC